MKVETIVKFAAVEKKAISDILKENPSCERIECLRCPYYTIKDNVKFCILSGLNEIRRNYIDDEE